ncbi:diaminopimelate dehydrogenase [Porphyromonas endodontalis]
MNQKYRVAVVGYGNIGRYALDAIKASPDFELAGVVRRSLTEKQPSALQDIPVVTSIDALDKVDVALLCTPTRAVEEYALDILSRGIATVDTFDIHSGIVPLRRSLHAAAIAHKTVAVLSAGWDPGSDSMVRTLMEAIVPRGITYTNFGPGMSMGHTVAVKAIEGVERALSITIPIGTELHRRMVYIELAPGYNEAEVAQRIKQDDYFAHDETHVVVVDDVDQLIDMGHGVSMERKGVSGATHNQHLNFEMRINNPALTAQVMVCAARAALRMAPGAYTMPEIAPIDLLPGDREKWITKLC